MTNVRYLVYIDEISKYNSELPTDDPEFTSQLNTAGFKVYQNESFSIKNIYIDLNGAAVAFNFNKTADAIKISWYNYLSESNLTVLSFSLSDIFAYVLEQNLYYENRFATIISVKAFVPETFFLI